MWEGSGGTHMKEEGRAGYGAQISARHAAAYALVATRGSAWRGSAYSGDKHPRENGGLQGDDAQPDTPYPDATFAWWRHRRVA